MQLTLVLPGGTEDVYEITGDATYEALIDHVHAALGRRDVLLKTGDGAVTAESWTGLSDGDRVLVEIPPEPERQGRGIEEALVALEGARRAIDCLTKAAITEMKNLRTPPPKVEKTCKAVATILGDPFPKGWPDLKKMVGDLHFLNRLKDTDPNTLKPANMRRARPLLSGADMTVDEVARVSRAAADLAQWAHAMDTFHRTAAELNGAAAT
eukprot:TRINITY_DN13244_c0_g1_i1.p1 TRINITY_DN13244_c0_g1~~TRINITY_DN13244_c0_g1_i1.p1  ORF type:complete len:211 (+),score=54.26 TRINITY_DN13244_c0_g1_i1:51-683(+)